MKSWKNIALALSLSLGSFAVLPSLASACDCKEGDKACHCKDCGKEGHACKHHKHKGDNDKGDKGGADEKKEAAPAK